eukprot:c24642_g1_i3 orf=112-2346(-)
MVVKMIKWRPWLAAPTRSFQVKIKLHSLEGLPLLLVGKSGDLGVSPSLRRSSDEHRKLMVKVKWKGPRGALGSRFQRSLKRAKTVQKIPEDGPIVTWEEEFEHTCTLTITKDGEFLPWDICFVINQVNARSKLIVLGTALMNVAKFVLASESAKEAAKIHVCTSSGAKCQAALVVTTDFIELRTPESVGFDHPNLSCMSSPMLCRVDDQLVDAAVVERSRTAKSTTSMNPKDLTKDGDVLDSSSRTEPTSDSSRNSFYLDSTSEWEEEEVIDPEEYCVHSYGPLTGVNLVVEGALSRCKENRHTEDHIPSACKRGCTDPPKRGEQMGASDSDEIGTLSPVVDQSSTQSSVRSILAWRKRKLNFRSPRRKGVPLLNKDYGEDGGDDIDFDRRLSGFPIKLPSAEIQVDGLSSGAHGCLDFGDEHFAVGSWERRDLFSRDGQMKLSGDVFLATIDQRSEKAAGESACTALVAVVAAWLHRNPGQMPIKAELDTLIREGSSEWRKLCNEGAYKDLFPDRHFDLDTVIRAKVRPLVELPEKSFIGFFLPNGLGDSCDYLQGAMSFESIWEEIIVKQEEDIEPAVYIVSWNDHFFILKVEGEVCYIIDTLGERLHEGGNQAYILRFDKDTCLSHVPAAELEKRLSSDCAALLTKDIKQATEGDSAQAGTSADQVLKEVSQGDMDNETVYRGKEACKEFIKGFFAALPLRELETDIKKGIVGSISLHQRLQIEFHYTTLVAGPPLLSEND